jgi:hypothetical protein
MGGNHNVFIFDSGEVTEQFPAISGVRVLMADSLTENIR